MLRAIVDRDLVRCDEIVVPVVGQQRDQRVRARRQSIAGDGEGLRTAQVDQQPIEHDVDVPDARLFRSSGLGAIDGEVRDGERQRNIVGGERRAARRSSDPDRRRAGLRGRTPAGAGSVTVLTSRRPRRSRPEQVRTIRRGMVPSTAEHRHHRRRRAGADACLRTESAPTRRPLSAPRPRPARRRGGPRHPASASRSGPGTSLCPGRGPRTGCHEMPCSLPGFCPLSTTRGPLGHDGGRRRTDTLAFVAQVSGSAPGSGDSCDSFHPSVVPGKGMSNRRKSGLAVYPGTDLGLDVPIFPPHGAYSGFGRARKQHPGSFSIARPISGTTPRVFPLVSVGYRFQILRVFPGYQYHFSGHAGSSGNPLYVKAPPRVPWLRRRQSGLPRSVHGVGSGRRKSC